jgi:ABC-2 type transport system permease protein
MRREFNAILVIAYRDFIKLMRDRARIIISLIFPLFFVGILGSSLQSNLGDSAGYNFLVFTFIGVLGQTLFSSTASGVISLIEDRQNDFSQEIFISPISRYSIIIGKIIGESLVALVQLISILLFGLVLSVPMDIPTLLSLIPAFLAVCFLGGAFGVLVLANLNEQRSANQVFPFLIFPQFFLAGVFNPIKVLPFYLDILSKITPMRYAVDLIRGIYYWGKPEYSKVVLMSPLENLAILSLMSGVFLILGTYLFVKKERNR